MAAGAGAANLRRRLITAKKAVRKSKEWKVMENLKADLKLTEASHARAVQTVLGVVDEIRNSGLPNLPLWRDAQPETPVSSNGDVHTAADQQPRGPVRRSAQRAAGKDAAP
jgi:hypothetical protein